MYNLAISNIAWLGENDNIIYLMMRKLGFSGLEIAPTCVITDNPYDNVAYVKKWAENLKEKNGFSIPSMQSIWYGRTEKIFATEEEREILICYTKKAIDFAAAVKCKNLVFGCPRNRAIAENDDIKIAIRFFYQIGQYASERNVIIALEANPRIYNTNFINTTAEAINFIKKVGSDGLRLNLDIGTLIANDETLDDLRGNEYLINHIHISEPRLKHIEKRSLHYELRKMLDNAKYDKYISIEMNEDVGLEGIQESMEYVRGVFQ